MKATALALCCASVSVAHRIRMRHEHMPGGLSEAYSKKAQYMGNQMSQAVRSDDTLLPMTRLYLLLVFAAGWQINQRLYNSVEVMTKLVSRAGAAAAPQMHSQREKELVASSQQALEECVEVYDNVLSVECRSQLSDPGYGVYYRSKGPRSAAEVFIESVLRNLGDETPEVEYWNRDEWLPLDAHRDADEDAAYDLGIHRFPSTSHIAYIDVEPELRAPTVLWKTAGSGSEPCHTGRGSEPHSGAKLVFVPAVEGRLLRFRGDMLHGVPRPTQQYLGMVDPDSERTYLRRVLLFNCWPEAAPGDDEIDEGANKLSKHLHKLAGCEPKAKWQKLQIVEHSDAEGDSPAENSLRPSRTLFQSSAFGTDDVFETVVHASSDMVVDALERPRIPSQLPIDAFLDSPTFGVPSVAGSRTERID